MDSRLVEHMRTFHRQTTRLFPPETWSRARPELPHREPSGSMDRRTAPPAPVLRAHPPDFRDARGRGYHLPNRSDPTLVALRAQGAVDQSVRLLYTAVEPHAELPRRYDSVSLYYASFAPHRMRSGLEEVREPAPHELHLARAIGVIEGVFFARRAASGAVLLRLQQFATDTVRA